MSPKKFLTTQGSTLHVSLGLLALRVLGGLILFLRHGVEKVTRYSALAQHFPDPLHIGVHASLTYALLTDAICSVLVIVGLGTRVASVLVLINLLTVFFVVHHAQFFSGDHVELICLYIAVFLCLVFTGAGRISLDATIQQLRPKRPELDA